MIQNSDTKWTYQAAATVQSGWAVPAHRRPGTWASFSGDEEGAVTSREDLLGQQHTVNRNTAYSVTSEVQYTLLTSFVLGQVDTTWVVHAASVTHDVHLHGHWTHRGQSGECRERVKLGLACYSMTA
jgi:hypothetical protein